MNHPIGLYINTQIWHKTKPSKPYTSFIFKIIWHVTSDSRMNQKNLGYLKLNIVADFTLIQKCYASQLSKFLFKHKKHLLVTKYTQETHAHACMHARTHTHTNANVYAVPTNMSTTQPTWSIKIHYYTKVVLVIKLLFPYCRWLTVHCV